ncbi:THO complex protein 7 [Drosophila tropicalis]|uniref:THO complex protein 7 n=1 Tax=Drosophila tropicalis TaxID=46794 RepID=UPI0035AB7773
MNDEEIIKQRLLIDGDGTGDDRRLNVLLKHFLKWANTKNDSPETNQMMYDRMMAHYAQCNLCALKNVQLRHMLNEERENYSKLTEMHQESIEIAKKEIDASKTELALAKQLRKNKMEYDLLASLINEQPDRSNAEHQIETIKKEIDNLIHQKMKMERKFEKRRNDFTLLMFTIHELEKELDQDDNNSTYSSSSSSTSSLATSENDLSSGADLHDNNGIMAVSEDEGDELNNSHSSANKMELPSVSTEDSKAMSVEEDAVLELSIDKDEHDVDVATVI